MDLQKNIMLQSWCIFEIYENKEDAAAREWKLKKWRRDWKDDLINERNPEWNDLYETICH